MFLTFLITWIYFLFITAKKAEAEGPEKEAKDKHEQAWKGKASLLSKGINLAQRMWTNSYMYIQIL